MDDVPFATQAMSSLAEGSDQVFAEVALELRIPTLAVLPMKNYASRLQGEALVNFRRLISSCATIVLDQAADPEMSFLSAGRYIVDHCDILYAVWDGLPSKGRGGTADVVKYAISRPGITIIQIDPIKRCTITLQS